jgi:HlyD family secretion protein
MKTEGHVLERKEAHAVSGMDRPLARPPPWRRYAPYGLAALLLAVGVTWLLVGKSGTVYRTPRDRLSIAAVTQGAFEDYFAVRGTATPFTIRYLTADQGGVVKQVLVEDGAAVSAHQPLVVLSNVALQLQVVSREADTAGQVNTLENTRLQLEDSRFKYQTNLLDIEHQIERLKGDLARDKILLDGNAIAPSVYAQEEADYTYQLNLRRATLESHETEQQVRKRELIQLGKALARLNENVDAGKASLEALTIRAPLDGKLTALDAEVGQSKAAGAVLGEVDSLDRFKLSAQVDEFYLGRVAIDQKALFTADGRQYEATVAKIYPQVVNGTFRVDLHFTEPAPNGIHVGQAVDMRLELGGDTSATMLPNGPFYQDTGGRWVFVLSPDGRFATRRSVKLGRRNPDFIEVLEGLAPGEKVIVSAYEAFNRVDRIEFK